MMDTGNDPRLSQREWRALSAGLQDVAECGCGAVPGSRANGLGRIMRVLTGTEEPPPRATPRLEALRNFVCATRRRRGADEFVPALLAQGFNRRQIEAAALLTF